MVSCRPKIVSWLWNRPSWMRCIMILFSPSLQQKYDIVNQSYPWLLSTIRFVIHYWSGGLCNRYERYELTLTSYLPASSLNILCVRAAKFIRWQTLSVVLQSRVRPHRVKIEASLMDFNSTRSWAVVVCICGSHWLRSVAAKLATVRFAILSPYKSI
jgi:hypothetical protein